MLIWTIPFFLLTLPICLWAAWSDLKFLKIPNILSILLALVFLLVGPLVLPLDDYMWRIIVGLMAFGIGFLVYFTGVVGGGDLKLIAAMLPYIAFEDLMTFAFLVSIMALAGVAAHSIVRRVGLAPVDWRSWQVGRKYPFGMSLAGSLIFYLALKIIFATG